MPSLKFYLLGTTLLPIIRPTRIVHEVDRVSVPNDNIGSGVGGIEFVESIEVPHLDVAQILAIDDADCDLVTRHFSENILKITLEGSFKFGTISKYRPADRALFGRFSDYQEGLQREVFHARGGVFNADIHGASFRGVVVDGFENPVFIEYSVNDYCSCLSVGDFSHERATLIRSRGNPEINSFVVYDFKKLRSAINAILKENDTRRNLTLVARKVLYGQKDRHWDIEDGFAISSDRDHLAIWLGTAFVKSPDYQHEDEVRILAIDPLKAGRLDERDAGFILNDPRIAEAIVASGHF